MSYLTPEQCQAVYDKFTIEPSSDERWLALLAIIQQGLPKLSDESLQELMQKLVKKQENGY